MTELLWTAGIYYRSGYQTYKPEEIKGMIKCEYHSVCFMTAYGKYHYHVGSVWLFEYRNWYSDYGWKEDLKSLCHHWSGFYPNLYAYAPIDEPIPQTPNEVSYFLVDGCEKSDNQRNIDLLMQH